MKNASSQGYIFISDVHLGAWDRSVDERLEQEVIALIDFCLKERLTIVFLGDLFEYWMEYPDPLTGIFTCDGPGALLRQKLSMFHKNGGVALFVTGNHDFWTFGGLESLGLSIHHDAVHLSLPDDSSSSSGVLCLHGDGLSDPEDELPRPILNRILRHRHFVRIYQAILPPGIGLALMKWFSSLTRKKPDTGPDRLNKWAEARLKTGNERLIICGHDHIARHLRFENGEFINCGAFFKTRTVALYTKEGARLVSWDPSKGIQIR